MNQELTSKQTISITKTYAKSKTTAMLFYYIRLIDECNEVIESQFLDGWRSRV